MGPVSTGVLERAKKTFDDAGLEFEMLENESKGRWPTVKLPANTVQPYRLVCELAAYAEAKGTKIFEQTAVDSISHENDRAHIVLDNGREISAGTAIVCTNAYSSYISGLGKLNAKTRLYIHVSNRRTRRRSTCAI